eukprot:2269995-Amphidinium_carterae.1
MERRKKLLRFWPELEKQGDYLYCGPRAEDFKCKLDTQDKMCVALELQMINEQCKDSTKVYEANLGGLQISIKYTVTVKKSATESSEKTTLRQKMSLSLRALLIRDLLLCFTPTQNIGWDALLLAMVAGPMLEVVRTGVSPTIGS